MEFSSIRHTPIRGPQASLCMAILREITEAGTPLTLDDIARSVGKKPRGLVGRMFMASVFRAVVKLERIGEIVRIDRAGRLGVAWVPMGWAN